jgi:hypothetical protein
VKVDLNSELFSAEFFTALDIEHLRPSSRNISNNYKHRPDTSSQHFYSITRPPNTRQNDHPHPLLLLRQSTPLLHLKPLPQPSNTYLQVIADLYERYIALIGEVIDDEGNTKSDGCVNKSRLCNAVADLDLSQRCDGRTRPHAILLPAHDAHARRPHREASTI